MEFPRSPTPAATLLAGTTPPSWATPAPLAWPTLTSPCMCLAVVSLLFPCRRTPLATPAIEKARRPPLVHSCVALLASAAAPLLATLDHVLLANSMAWPDSLRAESSSGVLCARGERRGGAATGPASAAWSTVRALCCCRSSRCFFSLLPSLPDALFSSIVVVFIHSDLVPACSSLSRCLRSGSLLPSLPSLPALDAGMAAAEDGEGEEDVAA